MTICWRSSHVPYNVPLVRTRNFALSDFHATRTHTCRYKIQLDRMSVKKIMLTIKECNMYVYPCFGLSALICHLREKNKLFQSNPLRWQHGTSTFIKCISNMRTSLCNASVPHCWFWLTLFRRIRRLQAETLSLFCFLSPLLETKRSRISFRMWTP